MKRLSVRSAAWIKLRSQVFYRDRGLCVICGVGLPDDGWECHHRRYRSRGGGDYPANLIAVCRGCHLLRIHNGDAAEATASGWAVSQWGERPESIPVRYFDGTVRLLSNNVEATCS